RRCTYTVAGADTTMKQKPPEVLRRDLRLIDAVGVGFGAIVGAGIFVVTGVAAGVAGPSLLAGLAIAAVAATANALSSAQLAAAYPVSGGTYEYGYRVLGPPFGFAAGWMFLAGKIASAGTVVLGLAGYLGVFVPDLPPRAIAVTAVIVFTILNAFGIRRSSQANIAIVAVSAGALLAFVVVGVRAFDGANLRPFAPAGAGGILRSAALLFFAYTGYARIATLGEEVRDPARTIPRAVVITIGIAVLLYFAVAAVALGVAGAPALADSSSPIHVAAEASGVSWLGSVVALGAVAAMLGVI